MLSSLAAATHAVVIGASGGIGSALVNALGNDRRVAKVHALSRTATPLPAPSVHTGHIDIGDADSVRAAADLCAADRGLDLVIVATGVLHDGTAIQPEKRLEDVTAEAMQTVFLTNTTGPALVARHFLPAMRRDGKSVFAVISARVGSITDNRLGGWASYRASKAALNMLIKTFAIEQARTRPESILVALHPGTVDTQLSRPFQGRVPRDKLFTPAHAADRLLHVIDGLSSADTGGFFAWDGSAIEY